MIFEMLFGYLHTSVWVSDTSYPFNTPLLTYGNWCKRFVCSVCRVHGRNIDTNKIINLSNIYCINALYKILLK